MDIEQINDRLKALASDPASFMRQHPTRRDGGGAQAAPVSLFDDADVASRRFVGAGDDVRKTLFSVVDGVVVHLEDVLPGRAPIEHADRPENLVDTMKHRTLAAMERADLTSAALAETPWSDDYWAIYRGQLGSRYADPGNPGTTDWEQNRNYVLDNPAGDIVAEGDAAAIDRLSPSEKYDLLMGDTAFSLTQHMWDQGQYYFDKNGEVETWMGICHGWAQAAYMLPRPRKAVTVLAADGRTPLTFYPADIKALASQLWAKARTVTRFIGGRCNDKDPATDENGRVTSSKCFDTNPGTWHMAVVNQIGVSKRSFIIDATYDYEVWNQPVHRYEYIPVHPIHNTAASLEDAITPIGQVTDDRFAKYRDPAAKYLCGIYMDLTYVVETSPTQRRTDSADHDAVRTVSYVYDLELDAHLNIVGGEWQQQAHPDFLWTPPPGVRAQSPADAFAGGAWVGDDTVPFLWRVAARTGSRQGLPLAKVVEGLVARAG